MIDDNPVNDILQSPGQRRIIKSLKLFYRGYNERSKYCIVGRRAEGWLIWRKREKSRIPVKITAICDKNPETLNKQGDLLGIPAAFRRFFRKTGLELTTYRFCSIRRLLFHNNF